MKFIIVIYDNNITVDLDKDLMIFFSFQMISMLVLESFQLSRTLILVFYYISFVLQSQYMVYLEIILLKIEF